MAVRTMPAAVSLFKYAGAGLSAILLTACATSGDQARAPDVAGQAQYMDAIGAFTNPASDPSSLDPIAAAAFWGTRYDREPQSAEMAVRYSAALRKIGSVDEAVTVMTKAIERHPGDADVNLELGKALVENSRAFEAVRYIETAVAERGGDWRALSAYGVALDQIGEHELAREKYDTAMLMAPEAVSVMNNKALSYALSGDLNDAVKVLRAATSSPRGDARVRQNLALVLALKGDLGEAERLARSDLPPQVADQNIQYFRSLMNQPAYWQEYAGDDFDAPSFEPAPETPAEPQRIEPAPLPDLQEEPRPEPRERDDDTPVALGPALPVTSASTDEDYAPLIKN